MLHVLNRDGVWDCYGGNAVFLPAAKSPCKVAPDTQFVVVSFHDDEDHRLFAKQKEYKSIRGTASCFCTDIDCEHSQALIAHGEKPSVNYEQNAADLQERLNGEKETE